MTEFLGRCKTMWVHAEQELQKRANVSLYAPAQFSECFAASQPGGGIKFPHAGPTDDPAIGLHPPGEELGDAINRPRKWEGKDAYQDGNPKLINRMRRDDLTKPNSVPDYTPEDFPKPAKASGKRPRPDSRGPPRNSNFDRGFRPRDSHRGDAQGSGGNAYRRGDWR